MGSILMRFRHLNNNIIDNLLILARTQVEFTRDISLDKRNHIGYSIANDKILYS
jgi:hypothetical protein